MRIYLDNCCFNRPFDLQNQDIIILESEADLHIKVFNPFVWLSEVIV